MSDRYNGKPFLRLLDSYVLAAIGALDKPNADWLTAAEPYFHETFGGKGTWREIVVGRMQFPAGMEAAIVDVWETGRTKFFEQTGEEPDPVQFAHTFVDTNFPS